MEPVSEPVPQPEPETKKKKGFWHKVKDVGGAIVSALVNGIAEADHLGGDD